MKIAVVGTGISGNLVAHLLDKQHEVHVFEANGYIGGHSNTVEFEAFGSSWRADTGFMVFNERTYPHFIDMLERLGVDSQDSDMSFSVTCAGSGLEYQGSSLNGLFAQRSNLAKPRFYRMLIDVFRFNRVSREALAAGKLDCGISVGDFLNEHRMGKTFRAHYLVPMVAAIWSAEPDSVFEFPAKFLLGFMHNHGLLQLRDRPQWKTVVGGSRSYVDRLVAPFRSRIRLNCPVQSVTRHAEYVSVKSVGSEGERFDQVVFASHADQALKTLTDPTPAERQTLQAFPYQANETVLHTDVSLMPKRKRAWASWNYHLSQRGDLPATLTYDLSRLQRLGTPEPVLLTLNHTDAIDPERIIRTIQYAHPAYSAASIDAQQQFDAINGKHRTYFCGAYWGYGFHEDGVNSALAVANYFDETLESCTAASTKDELHIAGTRR